MDRVHLAFGEELEKLAASRTKAVRLARKAAPFAAKRIKGIRRRWKTLRRRK